MHNTRRGALVALRLLVSGGLLAFLIWRASPGAIWQRWQQIDPLLLLGVAGLQAAGHMLSAAKWRLVLRAQGHSLPYSWLLRLYLIGQFANNFLPTTVGGDTVRAAQLGARIGSFARATASVLVERLTGFWALSLIGSLALLAPANIAATPWPLLLLVLFCAGATTLMLLAVGHVARAAGLLARLPLPERLRTGLLRLIEALETAAGAPMSTLAVLALSLLFQGMWVALHIVAGAALALNAPASLYALMVPLTDILGLAPIFFNNLGVREGVFSFYLGQIGIAPPNAVALAVLVFSVRLAFSAVGGALLCVGGLRQARAVLGGQQPASAP